MSTNDPRMWTTENILKTWLDWRRWQARGISDSDCPAFGALLDAAERMAHGDGGEAAARHILAISAVSAQKHAAAGLLPDRSFHRRRTQSRRSAAPGCLHPCGGPRERR